jgi:hypothetical protein
VGGLLQLVTVHGFSCLLRPRDNSFREVGNDNLSCLAERYLTLRQMHVSGVPRHFVSQVAVQWSGETSVSPVSCIAFPYLQYVTVDVHIRMDAVPSKRFASTNDQDSGENCSQKAGGGGRAVLEVADIRAVQGLPG